MNRNDKALLLAVCLGDGSLEKTDKNAVRLKIEHSAKQRALLEYKLDLVHSILGGNKPLIYETTRERAGSILHSCYFRKHHRYFRVLRKWLYTSGYKKVTRNQLNKLTPQAIAIWFMDDGSTELCTENSFRVSLCCDTTLEDCTIIQQYFEEVHGIKWNITKTKSHYRLRCSTKEARKLFDIIHSFIIPSMRYKISVPNHLWQECRTPIEI